LDIPGPETDGSFYAPYFYYYSFSTDEAASSSFRRLWKWSTDGGKRLSIPDVIRVIDEQRDSQDDQELRVNCIHDVIQHMTAEQMQEYMEKLANIALTVTYSPLKKISIAGVVLIDKIFEKTEKSLSAAGRTFILNLCSELFDSKQPHLVECATKWSSRFITSADSIVDSLSIFHSLFKGLSFFTSVSAMLVSDAWAAYSSSTFRCAFLNLPVFLDAVYNLIRSTFVLESQRYAVYSALEVILRSSGRSSLFERIETLIPLLFSLVPLEKCTAVLRILPAALTHAIDCVFQGCGEVFPYDSHLFTLYFDEQCTEFAGTFLTYLCANSPNCFLKSLGPFLVLAAANEPAPKGPFAILLRDEIPLSVELNRASGEFVSFALERGVRSEKIAFRPAGSRALFRLFEAMRADIRVRHLGLVQELAEIIPGRLWPNKEQLIDVMTTLLPLMNGVPDEIVAMIVAQAMREKSVYRAAAFRCIRVISELREVPADTILEAMLAAIKGGAFVAQQAAAQCAIIVNSLPRFADFVQAAYEKIEDVGQEDAIAYCKMLLELPQHEVPLGFYPRRFQAVAQAMGNNPVVDRLMARFDERCLDSDA
jgi:hypothetical protein